ncbi:UpxY family transcription antiterminator [Flavobacterium lacus]|uniref:Transcription antitermination factor NusG n=1 Tax=Flavobacterium lacus TaxID=1353778 RepID=A0A328WLW0_9FLAO|nr:UpxY family transcription antiterminator [Flavobacterium lacus]RAR47250.1 transcription antitermination factor NusG [Flavobacterium lacus]
MLNWYALYTKPKKEIKIAQQLEKLGFTVYIPTKIEVKSWSDRKKKVVSPLFSSYVFIQIEDTKRSTVFIIDGIMNYVYWLGKPAVIRAKEIEVMQQELAKPNDDVMILPLVKGECIQIKETAFRGQNAIVEYVSNNKVHLNLPSLGFKLIIKRSKLQRLDSDVKKILIES